MYPEVEQFVAAMKAARDEERRAYDAAWGAYNAAKGAANVGAHSWGERGCAACQFENGPAATERRAVIDAAWAAFMAAENTAWDALKASGDPLVAWIAANCREYPDPATQVLIALPASMDDLDTMARDMGWCSAWDQLRTAAEEAGVLPAPAAVPAESEVTA